jgi:hypothetical protein
VDALEELASDKNPPEFLGRFLATSVELESIRAAQIQINHSVATITRLAHDAGMDISSAGKYANDWISTLQNGLIMLAYSGEPDTRTVAMQRLHDPNKGSVVAH